MRGLRSTSRNIRDGLDIPGKAIWHFRRARGAGIVPVITPDGCQAFVKYLKSIPAWSATSPGTMSVAPPSGL
eukprot:6206987-Pleurochrysis_carterae.AAC.5